MHQNNLNTAKQCVNTDIDTHQYAQLIKAKLVLSNGAIFNGFMPSYNQDKQANLPAHNQAGNEEIYSGEVVFNTGMTGYEETLTDPSYSGQILTFTYPIIGNYGVSNNHDNFESSTIHVKAVVCQNVFNTPQHYALAKSFLAWIKEYNIPIIMGVDTRALTKTIREHGVINGAIMPASYDHSQLTASLLSLNSCHLAVSKVSCCEPRVYGNGRYKIILVDCGSKKNILNSLLKFDTTVVVVPYDYDYTNDSNNACSANNANATQNSGLCANYDGVFLSNGPGDPKDCQTTIAILKHAIKKSPTTPIYGICLGSQLMALAISADTYKLKFGHRGQNQPCLELATNKCYLTSQNHGYAVIRSSIPSDWVVSFVHLNDDTVAGINHKTLPFSAVQFHPEASPGPHDSWFFFERFMADVIRYKENLEKI